MVNLRVVLVDSESFAAFLQDGRDFQLVHHRKLVLMRSEVRFLGGERLLLLFGAYVLGLDWGTLI